ncbi:MAG: hypothetical protein AAF560_11060 [Acidobacteriota bacterium]
MSLRLALAILAISSPLILLTFVVPVPAGEWLFAMLAMVYPVALIALGAQRRGRLGPLLWPLIAMAAILVACCAVMLAYRGRILEAPWFGGLPLTTAVQFYGLFLAPVMLVSLAYAWTFDRHGLRQQDLDALRRRFGRDEPSVKADQAEADGA